MKKRILAMCMLFVMLLSVGCGGEKETTTLLFADIQMSGDHPAAIACEKFTQLVNKRTNGRVKVELYPNAVLGSEADQLTQLTVGGIDISRISGLISAYDERFKVFQALYLFDNEEDMWNTLNGEKGEELLNSEKLAENNMIGLSWFSGGSRNFYNSRKEIHTPADLQGMNIRVNTEPMTKFLENAGATPLNIAYNDIYHSIEKGVIDGAENNWPSYISTEHYKAAKYITIDRHTSVPEIFLISKSAYESLSAEDQKVIKECAKEVSAEQIEAMKEYDEKAIKEAEKAGCTITELTDAESEEFQKAGQAVNDELFKDNLDTIQWLTGK